MHILYIISGVISLGLISVPRFGAFETGVVQMTTFAWLQLGLYLFVLLLLVKPLGAYMARVYQGERTFLTPVVGPVERLIYRIVGMRADEEMDWKTYAIALLLFTLVGMLSLYGSAASSVCPAAQPSAFGSSQTRPGLQYRHQLHYQHQLAKLRRRDHHELSDPDARACGA